VHVVDGLSKCNERRAYTPQHGLVEPLHRAARKRRPPLGPPAAWVGASPRHPLQLLLGLAFDFCCRPKIQMSTDLSLLWEISPKVNNRIVHACMLLLAAN